MIEFKTSDLPGQKWAQILRYFWRILIPLYEKRDVITGNVTKGSENDQRYDMASVWRMIK